MEAPLQSGALITANLANEDGRDIYVLPGSLDNPSALGCLGLINKGAQVILGEDHLLEMLGAMPHYRPNLAEQFRRDFSRLAQILEKQQIKTAD